MCNLENLTEVTLGGVNSYLLDVKAQYNSTMDLRLAGKTLGTICNIGDLIGIHDKLFSIQSVGVVGWGASAACPFAEFMVRSFSANKAADLALTLSEFNNFWPSYTANHWRFFNSVMATLDSSMNRAGYLDCSPVMDDDYTLNVPTSYCLASPADYEQVTNNNVYVTNLDPSKPLIAYISGQVYPESDYDKPAKDRQIVSYIESPIFEINPGGSGNMTFSFSVPAPNTQIFNKHYIVEPIIISSAGELSLSSFKLETKPYLLCNTDSPFLTTIDHITSGAIHVGETIQDSFNSGLNTVKTKVKLFFEGSDVDLHVYSQGGLHVGKDTLTGIIELELPNATYVGDSGRVEEITFTPIQGATYTVIVRGVDIAGADYFNVDVIEEISIPANYIFSPDKMYVSGYLGDTIAISGNIYETFGQHEIILDSLILDAWLYQVGMTDSLSTINWVIGYDNYAAPDSFIIYTLDASIDSALTAGMYSGKIRGFIGSDTVVCDILVDVMFANCGDANGDDNINLLDILYLISYLYGNPPGNPPDPIEAGDANADHIINLLDILYLIDFLYGDPAGPEPQCP